VPFLFRPALKLTCVAASLLALARGQNATPTSTADAANLPPELAALLVQPAWSISSSARVAFGYKDNVLLSHADEERSGFARGGFDTMLWHVPKLPDGRIDYFVFAGGEGTRYFSSASVDHEERAFLRAQWRYQIPQRFKCALDLKGYYDDQIFDVSDTDVRRLVAELKVRGATLGPSLHWDFFPSLWLEAEGFGKRERDRDGVLANRTADGALRFGWHHGERVELSVAGMERFRHYDYRKLFSSVGRELDDTYLKIREREGEVRLVIGWDAAWKTTMRAGVLRYIDNGSGFFNYHQRGVTQEIEWERGRWSASAEASARRLAYDVQAIGYGSPTPLVKDEFSTELRLARKLSARWSIFGEYTWERRRSNDPIAAYNVNEGLLGIRWNWEK